MPTAHFPDRLVGITLIVCALVVLLV